MRTAAHPPADGAAGSVRVDNGALRLQHIPDRLDTDTGLALARALLALAQTLR
ncbi:hypothetical protein [Actinomadura algeriensis]|uniref:Uncharacterized protein n=1 Tax=Actinomadura algeriensis TaxID=1679523 RepID=A0ABR9K2F4_9ACTN|nr:hypothetical protein [Actinomadura algeriensis]MBE1537041.1 hypothetical protein [Actinomadura algeriensis]